jgi:hypothetical protein
MTLSGRSLSGQISIDHACPETIAVIKLKQLALCASIALVALAPFSIAEAQSSRPVASNRDPHWGDMAPGTIMGPGIMNRSEFNRMCRPGAAGFAEWRIDRLESILKPTDVQRAKFNEFKAASNEAGNTMRTACPTALPTSMVSHMQAMEKLTDAKALAIKTVLPALEAFYATLSPDQKISLDSREGRSRFWR